MTLESLADVLDGLQARENQGRGISSVQTLIDHLRRNDHSGAESVARNEWDKISSYPAISQLLIAEGLFTPVNFSAYID